MPALQNSRPRRSRTTSSTVSGRAATYNRFDVFARPPQVGALRHRVNSRAALRRERRIDRSQPARRRRHSSLSRPRRLLGHTDFSELRGIYVPCEVLRSIVQVRRGDKGPEYVFRSAIEFNAIPTDQEESLKEFLEIQIKRLEEARAAAEA